MSLLSLGLLGWVRVALPDVADHTAHAALPLRRVLGLPGIAQVLAVMLLFVLAHNLLYTYVAPLLALSTAAAAVDRYLLLFGVAALFGIVAVGVWIDRWMRALLLASVGLFTLAALAMALWPHSPTLLAVAVAVWGLAFGGCATLFQTAIARRAGDAADLAQSLVVTGWNLAIAGGGVLGGSVAAAPWRQRAVLDSAGAAGAGVGVRAATTWLGAGGRLSRAAPPRRRTRGRSDRRGHGCRQRSWRCRVAGTVAPHDVPPNAAACRGRDGSAAEPAARLRPCAGSRSSAPGP
ncbi:putative membrane protein [Xanthomonas translucens pv. phlei]|uniref:Putative membrane protein n=1 Tax=Xanthomonas graminis pv. phlei TaxID=487906 RepID=A0A0K2ZC09_9XANT|nr:putative membrane protein [Xanthomonas translucens pv. phlei]